MTSVTVDLAAGHTVTFQVEDIVLVERLTNLWPNRGTVRVWLRGVDECLIAHNDYADALLSSIGHAPLPR